MRPDITGQFIETNFPTNSLRLQFLVGSVIEQRRYLKRMRERYKLIFYASQSVLIITSTATGGFGIGTAFENDNWVVLATAVCGILTTGVTSAITLLKPQERYLQLRSRAADLATLLSHIIIRLYALRDAGIAEVGDDEVKA